MVGLRRINAENPMARTWSKAALVRRKFKAGRPIQKDRVLSPIAAIHEGCILLDDLRNAMRDAGLSPDDVRVGIVFVTPETPDTENVVYTLRIPRDPRDLPKLFKKMEEIVTAAKVLPLGLLAGQTDRETMEPDDPKSGAVVWVQPFLTGDRAVRALKTAKNSAGDTALSFN